MYPFIRLAWNIFIARRREPIGLFDTHVSYHYCLPWDLDMWREMNNGRVLTIYDLGRIPFAARLGLLSVLKQKRWGLTMAGAVVRYRQRVRMFARLKMLSKVIYWDDKFIYIEQSAWLSDGQCANHIVYRSAITSKEGIVPPSKVAQALGYSDKAPKAPDWVADWLTAEAKRPWPPMQD